MLITLFRRAGLGQTSDSVFGSRRSFALLYLASCALFAVTIGCSNTQTRDIKPTVRSNVEQVLGALFRAYEQENGARFMTYVHRDFAGTASNGVALNYSTIRLSIEEDFLNYDEIQFDWTVNAVREYEEGKIVEAEVTWSARYKNAVGPNSGKETRNFSQVSTFVFLQDGDALTLSTWSGAAAFGLAAPGGVGR